MNDDLKEEAKLVKEGFDYLLFAIVEANDKDALMELAKSLRSFNKVTAAKHGYQVKGDWR